MLVLRAADACQDDQINMVGSVLGGLLNGVIIMNDSVRFWVCTSSMYVLYTYSAKSLSVIFCVFRFLVSTFIQDTYVSSFIQDIGAILLYRISAQFFYTACFSIYFYLLYRIEHIFIPYILVDTPDISLSCSNYYHLCSMCTSHIHSGH